MKQSVSASRHKAEITMHTHRSVKEKKRKQTVRKKENPKQTRKKRKKIGEVKMHPHRQDIERAKSFHNTNDKLETR